MENKGRGTLVTAIVLSLVFVAMGGVAVATVATNGFTTKVGESVQHSDQTSSEESGDSQTDATPAEVQDKEAAPDPEPETTTTEQGIPSDDERAAELALDPARNTGWNTEHNNGVNTVYLTFDDGPSENTAKILDILDRYNAKATFFVTGHNAGYRSSIGDAYRRGHSVGMHTMTHDYSIYDSVDAYFDDLHQVEEVVKEQIGYVPYLIRFPGGSSNTVSLSHCTGIMTTLSQEVVERGYQYYDWNVSSNDAAANTVPTQTIIEASCVEGYPNVMLLFHDSSPKTTTVEALPTIIEFYQARGYEFKAIDRSVWVQHHRISN